MVMMKKVFDSCNTPISIGRTGVLAEYSVYFCFNTNTEETDHRICIFTWHSKHRDQGRTNEALRILKESWDNAKIHVDGCGMPGSDSYKYWHHQLNKNRVDLAIDDNDEIIPRS